MTITIMLVRGTKTQVRLSEVKVWTACDTCLSRYCELYMVAAKPFWRSGFHLALRKCCKDEMQVGNLHDYVGP